LCARGSNQAPSRGPSAPPLEGMQSGATFEEKGYALTPQVLSDAQCAELETCISAVDLQGAGTRELLSFDWARRFARQLRDVPELAPLLGDSRTAIQCTYFAKLSSRNWLVTLHQDLSIPVAARAADAPCKAWSEKEGTWFCQPPAEFLAQLVAVRVHLDDSTEANGPLRVVPGSHRLGRIASHEIAAHRRRLGEVACVAPRRSLLAMRPLLLHASSKSTSHAPRRVLHFVFAPAALPWGLRWKHAF
jgi:phytanoyl-CoA dioxygenase PhyH